VQNDGAANLVCGREVSKGLLEAPLVTERLAESKVELEPVEVVAGAVEGRSHRGNVVLVELRLLQVRQPPPGEAAGGILPQRPAIGPDGLPGTPDDVQCAAVVRPGDGRARRQGEQRLV